MGLFDKLQEQHGFTNAEKQIAAFILAHSEKIMQMNIADLTAQTYSSNATVIRLCHKLGVKGYREFRIQFASEVEKQRREKRFININYPFSPAESNSSIVKSIAELSKEALDACYASVPISDLEKAARWIWDADRVYLGAIGDTQLSAMGFCNLLLKLGIHAVIANQYGEERAIAYDSTPRDVVLFISYSGSLMPLLKDAFRIFRRHRCRTILLTSLSEFEGIDHLITIPAQEIGYDKIATFYSQESIRYVLNCIYALIYSMDFHKNRDRKNQAEGLPRPGET